MTQPRSTVWKIAAAAGLACALASPAPAQDGDEPEDPAAAPEGALRENGPRDALGRRITNGQTTTLAFRNVTVDRLIPFIVETTGKVVLPMQEVLTRRITIINDRPLPQSQALDLVFLALQQNGVAVVETLDLITLRDIAEIVRQDVPVLGPDTSVLARTDYGTIAEKVYRLNYASAESLGETLDDADALPDYAKITIDPDSNQIVVLGNIALLQRMERLITSLDRPNAASLQTATFRLRFADAEQVAQNIKDLYEEQRTNQQQQGRAGGGNPFQQFLQQQQQQRGGGRGGNQQQQQGRGEGGGSPGSVVGSSANLRVTANKQQNSVTVLAEPPVLDQIRRQIEQEWDQPLAEEAVVPRTYDLHNSDPVKVRDMLEGLFGQPGATQTQAGATRLSGQFSFQALPDSGRLVVLAKSPDNLFVIDEIIRSIDQPQSAGLPEIVELKHASSEELAEQLNTLLAQEGTLAQIRRSESGLTESDASVSPFATDTQAAADQQDTAGPEFINFWWQRARPPTDNRGISNLVGKIRIVPVWRQNAVMVMAPPEYRFSVADLIRQLDQPGRQVLLSAIVIEISGEDATALGLRWSNQTIVPTNQDNVVSVGTNTTATENDFLGSLFDTSVLNVNANLNLLLQALNQKTKINILSEPRIFTSDNQEAEFFDGQDVPFITDSQNTDQGNVIQSFDYRAVGIQLRVRPRITPNHEVDLRVNLELSSINPEQTLFGGFIVDRRETTTQLIVRDGQTIVISGILRGEESDIKRKIPFLGDIPLIGALFTSTEKTIRNAEVVAFITPLIVDNEARMDDVNTPFRQRLGELREQLGSEVNKSLGEAAEPAATPQEDPPLAPPPPDEPPPSEPMGR